MSARPSREEMIDEAVRRVGWNQSGYVMLENQMKWLLRQDRTALQENVAWHFRRLENQIESGETVLTPWSLGLTA